MAGAWSAAGARLSTARPAEMTSGVRLLGAEMVLTGIRPEIARTIVDLQADISAMHTRSHLAEGIELGLRIIGKAILPDAHGHRPTGARSGEASWDR
jgi:hypothetical protein